MTAAAPDRGACDEDMRSTREALARTWGITPHTALHLEAFLRQFPGAVVTSGHRTRLRNRIVGGSPNSWHLKGRAVDVVLGADQLHNAVHFAWASRVTPRCTGPEEVLDEGDHLHIAW